MSCVQRLLAVLFLALVAGGAQAGLFDDDEARRQIADLKAEVAANQAAFQKALEDRMGRLDAAFKDRAVDLAQMIDGRMEGLRQDLTRLRGQIEVLVNQAETMERRQKDLYVDLDTRMRRLEQSAQEKVAAPEREVQKEKAAYEAALNQFKVGNYQACVAAFQTFVVNYPNSQFVPAAQYWIGNAYYATKDYKVAIATQEKVVASWPDNVKAPDAMLNIASAQAELGDQKSARETLRMLIEKYPTSRAAEEAKLRIQKR
jgi:tol-pal system protein YbgF